MRHSGSTLLRLARAFRNDRGGSAAVDFGLVAPAFVMMVFGVLGFAQAMHAKETVAQAVREGARYAIVRGADSDAPVTAADMVTLVRSRAVGIDSSRLQVTTTFTPDNKPGSTVTVSASYSYVLLIPIVALPDLTFTGSSTMTIVR